MKVIEQPPALANHHEQSPAGAVVFLELLQVIGEMIDPLREQRDLDIRRTGVPLVQFKIANRLYLRIHTNLLIELISSSFNIRETL